MTHSTLPARANVDEGLSRLGWTMVSAKVRAGRNQFTVTRRKSPVLSSLRFAVIVPVIVGFTALLTIGFASALSQVEERETATTIVAIAIALSIISAFVGSSTTALQALYLADDIPFLITLPIPLKVLFGTKFIEAAIGTAPSSMLMTAAVAGYGLAYSGSPLFWLVGLIALVGAAVMATATSVIVVSVVTRFIPPRRARVFLLSISLFVIALTMLGWRLLLPQPDKINLLVEGERFGRVWSALGWTPAGWTATALTESISGQLIVTLYLGFLLVITSGLAIALSFRVFQRTFIRSLSQTRNAQTAQPNESITTWLGRGANLLPRDIGSLVLKEWLVFSRDLRRLSGAVWPVGVVVMYTVLLAHGSGSAFGSGDLQFWSRNGSLALLPWGLSLGISVYAYGSEGRNIHLLRSLPVSARMIFAAKVIAAFVPVATISILAAVLSLWIRQAPLEQSVQLVALLIWMIAGYVLIDTAAAAFSPNFEASHIQRTIGMPGRFYSFALGSIFSLITLVGITRLIFFGAKEPSRISGILHVELAGIEPFGWPLVVTAAVTGIGVLFVCAEVAIRQTAKILASPN